MNDLFAMGVIERGAKLLDQRFQEMPRQHTAGLLHSKVREIASIDILHGNESLFVRRLVEVMDAHDVRMRQFAAARGFAAQIIERGRVIADLRRKKL